MLPNTPLIKNLNNPDYVKIILNGKSSLAERFAEIDIKLVREELRQQEAWARKYPKGMAKVFKLDNLPQKLVKIVAKRSMAA